MSEPVDVTEHLGLVRLLAARACNRAGKFDLPIDDSDEYSAGCIGLMKAAVAFDPSRGIRFCTFAWHCIRREIADCQRTTLRGIRRLKHGERLPQRVSMEAAETAVCELPDLDAQLDAAAFAAAGLSQLKPRDIEIVRRVLMHGEQSRAVASDLGISPQAVANALFAAKQQLAAYAFTTRIRPPLQRNGSEPAIQTAQTSQSPTH